MDSKIIYLITDDSLEFPVLIDRVEKSLSQGVSILQYRSKNQNYRVKLTQASILKRICEKYNTKFIINDDVDIAVECDADGVHLGQSDMHITNAKKLLNKDIIIGITAKNVDQALEAEKFGATYLGVGAIFPSSTKKDAQTLSIDGLKSIRQAVNIPIYTIGGLTLDNITDELLTYCDGICIVSHILFNAKPDTITKKLITRIKNI